jgi:hypothetical protein
MLTLSICAWYALTSASARAEPSVPAGTGPEILFADGFETPKVTSAGPAAPWTKIVSPAIVLDVEGDPTGTLIIALPCFVIEPPTPIEPGDVLAAAIGSKTPNGLLRKVLSISPCENGIVLLTTDPARLSDALPEGALVLSDDLSDLVVPDFVPTSEDGTVEPVDEPLTANNAEPPAAPGAVGTIAEPGRFNFGCFESDQSGFELKVKPVFSLDPDVTFSFDWGAANEVHVQIGGTLQGEIGAEFSATGTVLCEAEFKLVDDLSLGKKLIFVGPVPVVVEPLLNLGAKLSGTAEAVLQTSASSTGNVGALLSVDRESGLDEVTWNVQPSGSFNGFLDLEVEGEIEGTLSLEPSFGFLLYGVVAPTAALNSGLTAKFETCESPNLTLRQPVELEVSLKPSEWLGDMLEPLTVIDLELGHTFNLPGSPYLLYGADIQTNLPCEDETVLPNGRVGEVYSTPLVIEMPPGANNPVYTVTDGTVPPGLELTGDGTLQGTPTQSNIHHFDATATHSLGMSTGKFKITILEAEALEITTTSLPGGTVGQEYSFALEANRPAGQLTWAVTGGDLPLGVVLAANGTFSGIPTEAGNYPITVEATHAISTQTDVKLFAITVLEDIGGSTLGIDEGGEPAADVRPDGSTAAILRQDWHPDLEFWLRWRLVKAGPDGAIDFDVDIPGDCSLDPACVFGLGSAKSAVRIMPDGGAAVAFLGDDENLGSQAIVLRYGPAGNLLWGVPITSIRERSQIAGFQVAPDGRIALVSNEAQPVFDTPALYCDALERGMSFLGSIHVEFDADGTVIRENEYRTEGDCDEAALGLGQISTHITGLAVDADGDFVAVGFTEWVAHGDWPDPYGRAAEPFRIDLDTLQLLSVTGGKLPVGLAASGTGLFVSLGDANENGGVSFPLVLGSLVNSTATALAAPLLCPTLSGVAGTPGSLFSNCEGTMGRLSDAGALVVSRTLPVERLALAIVAGLGGQVFTVESRDPGFPDPYDIVGAVLNPDLSDLD